MYGFIVTAVLVVGTNAIFDGTDASIKDFPYHVSVERNGFAICQGSIIAENWIITVGQYCATEPTDVLQIRAGTSKREEGGSIHQVDKIIDYHEFHFNINVYEKGVALMRVEKPFKFDENCQPIKLPKADERLASGQIANLTGLGRISTGSFPENLQSIQIPILELDKCDEAYQSSYGKLPRKGLICAGYYEEKGGRAACANDEGAPLVVNGRLVGIVSYIYSFCNEPKHPAIYADIGYYRDWIHRHVDLESTAETDESYEISQSIRDIPYFESTTKTMETREVSFLKSSIPDLSYPEGTTEIEETGEMTHSYSESTTGTTETQV